MSQKIEILDVVRRKDATYCESLLAELRPETTEILLSRCGLEELCSFARFKCIEALWLNDNQLSEIKGLDTNVQIKALYLHNNRLANLEPKRRKASGRGCEAALSFLSHIQTLSLYNNCLQDLQATLREMSHLSHLEDLDKHEITREERLAASTLYGENKAKTISFLSRKPLWRNPPTQPIGNMSLITREMYKEIERTKRRRDQEELARTQSLMASTTRPISQGTTVPLATAVEMVTANSRTLKDLLAIEPGEGRGSAGDGGNSSGAAESHNWTADPVRGRRRRDFFMMKRFVSTQWLVQDMVRDSSSAPRLLPSDLPPPSRTSSAVGTGSIVLDSAKYGEYLKRKAAAAQKTRLLDWTVAL